MSFQLRLHYYLQPSRQCRWRQYWRLRLWRWSLKRLKACDANLMVCDRGLERAAIRGEVTVGICCDEANNGALLSQRASGGDAGHCICAWNCPQHHLVCARCSCVIPDSNTVVKIRGSSVTDSYWTCSCRLRIDTHRQRPWAGCNSVAAISLGVISWSRAVKSKSCGPSAWCVGIAAYRIRKIPRCVCTKANSICTSAATICVNT